MKRAFIKSGRKALTLLIAGALLTTFLSGCKKVGSDMIIYDPNDVKDSEKVSITFFGYKADAINLTAIEKALQSFMAENKNIDITYEGIKGTAYWDAFNKRDAAGVLDDVFMMHHDNVVTMSAEGKLADLSDIAGIENYTTKAREQFINPDGTIYFLPTAISTYNLYINYDLLKAHGLSVPQDYADFQKCCDYFVSAGVTPIIANNFNSLSSLIVSKGLYDVYQRPDEDAYIKELNRDPAALAKLLDEGVELVADMIERGYIDPAETLVTEQTSDDLDLFVKGDRPFMISGGWASVRVKAMKPDFTYGVHPYPILDDGCVLSYQVDTCISVNANSEAINEAKAFVEYLIEPDVMWNYCDSQASYTPLSDTRQPSEKTIVPSAEYLTNGSVVFGNDYRLDLPMETALAECADVLLNGGTAEEAEAVIMSILTA